MLITPNAVFDKFIEFVREKGFSAGVLTEYKKWLRYYLDFCDKYPVPDSKSERVRMFAEKLREKKQTEKQRERAAHAVSLYFEMQREDGRAGSEIVLPPVVTEFRGGVYPWQDGDVSSPAAFPRLGEEGAYFQTENE